MTLREIKQKHKLSTLAVAAIACDRRHLGPRGVHPRAGRPWVRETSGSKPLRRQHASPRRATAPADHGAGSAIDQDSVSFSRADHPVVRSAHHDGTP